MKKIISKTISHPFFSSSLIMIAGTNSTNAINYIYHLAMGRLLGPASYGELSAFFSLIGLLSVVPLSFGTVVIKFAAAAKTDQEVASYLKWFQRPVFILSIVMALGTILFSPFLADYLKTTHIVGIILIGVSFIFSLPAYLYRAVLQGLIKFNLVVISLISETSVKLLAGLMLVVLGFDVTGAMVGLLMAIITGWVICFYFLKKYRQTFSVHKVITRNVFSFTLPVLVQSVAVTSLMTIDLVLVKHYFSSFDTGIFAAVSTMGKIILFASSPISVVMFPLVTQRFAKGEKYLSLFALSMAATLLMIGGVLMMYFLFPQLFFSLLYGDKYFAGISLLVPYSIFTGLLALSGLYINFFLSVNKNRAVIFPLLAALVQFSGIIFFHQTLIDIIWVSISVATLLFISLSVYFLAIGGRHEHKINAA